MSDGLAPRYQLGLSLSGAISAGAYSAGVLDFLLQALDCWEAAAAGPDVPAPGVGLKVLSGASAGAITAAVGAIALAGDPGAERFPESGAAANTQPYKYCFRRLYETWVVKPALVADDGGTDLLSLSDLGGRDVLSALNASLLDEIAAEALDFTGALAKPVPARAYVSGSLHIYLTLANLRGTPYYVKFTGGTYGMMQHGDRSHYVLTGFGTWSSTSRFADSDAPSYTLVAADLFVGDHPGWKAYANSALASAAFPVGLAPRIIATNIAEYEGRRWPVDEWQTLQAVKPVFADAWKKNHLKGAFSFTAVDGGVINNDPFEYAFFSLADTPEEDVKRLDQADRGVIMIAPFPEQPTLPPDGVPAAGLISAYLALMPALKEQVRFKPSAFALAGDDDVGNRYMISPSRPLADDLDARFPIASGLLNGFGGFVSRAFRDHDFQLGRRNCQRFLQTTFVLPPTNPVIAASYAGVDERTAYFAQDPQRPEDAEALQVLPLFGDAALEVVTAEWPRISEAELAHILQRLGTRLGKVSAKVLSTRQGLPMLKLLAPFAGMLVPRLLKRTLLRSFLADLVKRDQLIEWMLPAGWSADGQSVKDKRDYEQDTRAVIAALLAPAYDLRTIDGLMVACDLEKSRVDRILAQCAAGVDAPYHVWLSPWFDSQGSNLVCLMSDRPGWFKRDLGRDHAGSLFFPPKIDPPVLRVLPDEVIAA